MVASTHCLTRDSRTQHREGTREELADSSIEETELKPRWLELPRQSGVEKRATKRQNYRDLQRSLT